MNTFEVLILAMALVFSSWISYRKAGIMLVNEPFVRKIYYTGITLLIQFVMAGAGIWVGYKVGSIDLKVNALISFSILLIFGLIILLTNIRMPVQEKENDYTNNKAILLAALAEGITPLSIGIAIGLLSLQPYLHLLLIGLFFLAGIAVSQLIAKRKRSGSPKLKLGSIAGLLLLAAAIKLMLNITGF